MANADDSRRIRAGHVLEPFTVETLSHGALRIPGTDLVHLQFRRFAGCPICSLHLRSFAKSIAVLEAAGVRTVAFFHSSMDSLRPYHADLPFPVVPDPERHWYRRFGVERSVLAVANPKAIWAAMKGLVGAPSSPFEGEGGINGLPADFLIRPTGEIVAAHYGRHADDQWEVDDVASLARRSTP